jgi:hypothetical protein
VDATHSCGYRTVILSVRYGARSVSRSINKSGSQTTGTMSGAFRRAASAVASSG